MRNPAAYRRPDPVRLVSGRDGSFAADKAVPRSGSGTYAREVRPLLAKYCFRCHSGDEPKGDLKLDGYQDVADVVDDRKVWLTVAERLRDAEMPPEGELQPPADAAARVVAWLDGQLDAAERQGPRDPGRVTIRRLNRAEYNNTIRDLLGLDFQPADDFPSDDVGYGFDNIGDVLSMPPILLEKYLSAAQSVASRAIVAHPAAKVIAKVDARKADGHDGGQPFSNGAWQFPSNGELFITIRPPTDGQYVFRVTAFGQQAGTDPARMSLRIDGKEIGLVDVPAVELAPQTYELRTNLTTGDHRFSVAFVNDFYNPNDPNPANRDRNLVVEKLEVTGSIEAALADLPETHRRIIPHEPGADGRRDYAREILVRIGGARLSPAGDRCGNRAVGQAVRVGREPGAQFCRRDQAGAAGRAGFAVFLVPSRVGSGGVGSGVHSIAERLRACHAAFLFLVEQHAR